jgi:hypothetical protein
MGFSVADATNAWCMRRNRGELRLLLRTDLFLEAVDDFLRAEDGFLRDLAGLDGAFAGEAVLLEVCENAGPDEHTSALKHSAK